MVQIPLRSNQRKDRSTLCLGKDNITVDGGTESANARLARPHNVANVVNTLGDAHLVACLLNRQCYKQSKLKYKIHLVELLSLLGVELDV